MAVDAQLVKIQQAKTRNGQRSRTYLVSTRIVFLLVHGPNLEVCRAIRLLPLNLEDILLGFGRHGGVMMYSKFDQALEGPASLEPAWSKYNYVGRTCRVWPHQVK